MAERPESAGHLAGAAAAAASLKYLSGLLAALAETATPGANGEVVARSASGTGRVFVADGRIAWAVTSSSPRTFGRQLVQAGLVQEADLTAVFAECKASGSNFAETLVAWGLISEQRLRDELLTNVAGALLEILGWQGCVAMFVPSRRVYSGKLTFEPAEVFRCAARLDKTQRLPVHHLLPHFEGRAPEEAFASMLERIRKSTSPDEIPTTGRARVPPATDQLVGAEGALRRLRDVDAFQAAGMFDASGTLLRCEAIDGAPSSDHIATACAGFLSRAQRLVAIGWPVEGELILQAERGTLLLRRCDLPQSRQLGVFLLLSEAGRLHLARLQLDRVLPELVAAVF